MASENCMLDIHICGACRSEFNDIYKFIQHKKECYLSLTRGQVPELSHLTGQCIQDLQTSDGLELQLQNTELQNDAYPYSTANTDHLNNATDIPEVSVQMSTVLTSSEHSMPHCVRKDSSQCSYALNSAMLPEHKSLDVTAPYSFSWSTEHDIQDEAVSTTVEHNVTENELALVTDVGLHRKNSMKADNVEESKNHEDIATDNIAVYVMSPKSFASSVRTQSKFDLDSRSKPPTEFSTRSLWSDSHSELEQQNHILDAFASVMSSPNVNSKRSYISCDGGDQHNDLMYVHQDTTESGMHKSVINSGFYNNSELTLSSNNSTPCPEDLEVGQISAVMFGKKNHQEDLKIVGNVSTTQAIDTVSESVQDSCKNSFLNSTSVLSQAEAYYKMLVNDVNSVQGFIRDNTASAPLIKTKKGLDCQTKRRVSVEKRERLQGVSDDLLSSPIKYTQASSARSQGLKSAQTAEAQATSGNITSAQLSHTSAEMTSATAAGLTSYKAIFTSPSSGGHRLTPTQAGLSEPSHCSIEGFLNLKRQLFTKGSSGFVSKSVEYKNISASVQKQSRQSEALLPHNISGSLTAGKNYERGKIKFEKRISPLTRCPEKLTMNQDLMVSANQGHSVNAAQTLMKMSDYFHHHQSSVLIPSLNTPQKSSDKAHISLSTNELQEHQLNTDYNVELSVINDNIHLEDDVTIPIMSNLSAVQRYIGEISSGESRVTTTSDTKLDHPLVEQKDNSHEVISSSCAKNSSVLMIYKNNEGNIIMVPKVLYTKAVQKNSQTAEVSCAKMELSLKNEYENFEQNSSQQQTSESGVYLDVIHARDSSSSISQHDYIQNLGSSFFNQSHVASDVHDNTVVVSTDGSYIINQATSSVSNSTHHKTVTYKEVMAQKPPISSSRPSKSATLDKEKYIIKPNKEEGLSKSPAAPLEQLDKDVKKTLQTPAIKDVLMSDVTEWEEDKKIRSFTCKFDECRYTTTMYKDFQRHYRRHTGEKPYQCVDCGKTFNRSDRLKMHQRRHSGLKPFKCKICDYAAIEGGSLRKHMRTHSNERPFKCQICSYASRNSSQLIVHLRTHTGDSPFHCTKCSAKFKINSDLKRHMRIHTGEKPFHCEKCDYKSSYKGNLKTHMKINHLEEKEIPCPVCTFVTSSKKRRREHEKTHNVQVIKCSQCDYTCANLGQLRSHIIIHNSFKPYRCNFCSYSSKQSGNLKKHVQNMHLYKMQPRSKNSATDLKTGVKLQGTRRENVLLPIAEKLNVQKRRGAAGCWKLHTCGQCDSSFVREDSLRCHMKQHNTTTEENTLGKESIQQTQIQKVNADSQHDNLASTTAPSFYGHQGIQHIVAAASKIYEENYGTKNTTNNSPTVSKNLFASKEVPDVNLGHPLNNSQSQTGPGATTVNDIKHKKATSLQVPWEHRSYTLSVSSDHEESHLSATSQDVPFPSVLHTKAQTQILKMKSPQNKCNKIHHNLQHSKDDSFSPPKRQASKECLPKKIKSLKVEKAFSSYSSGKSCQIMDEPSQHIRLYQHGSDQPVLAHQALIPSDSTSEEPGAKSTVLFTQQGADGSTVGSFYNVELVPQFDSSQGARKLHQLPMGAMHIQLQPTTHIQIVMPGAAVPKFAKLISGQSNPVMPQILLQVQESSESSQVFAIPTGSFNALQTTDQIISHTLGHCTLQQNGQTNTQTCSTTECHATNSTG